MKSEQNGTPYPMDPLRQVCDETDHDVSAFHGHGKRRSSGAGIDGERSLGDESRSRGNKERKKEESVHGRDQCLSAREKNK